MDSTDKEILKLLQSNARMTFKEIGNIVGLTSPAVSERIKKMEESKIILGYHAEINPSKVGKSISAIIGVNVHPNYFDRFTQYCKNHNSIIKHFRVIGSYNAIIYVVLSDSYELEELINEIKKFGPCLTSIITSTIFSNKIYN